MRFQQKAAKITKEFQTASGYDRASELLSANLRDAATGNLVKPYTYRYDAAGNRRSEQVDNTVTTGTYNNLNQLTNLVGGGTLTLEGTVSEPATLTIGGQNVPVNSSNRFRTTVQAVSGSNSIAVTATDGSGNTTSQHVKFTVSVIPQSFNYDLNGNLTWDGVKGYEWDAANRLIAIDYGSPYINRTEFGYDGLGRRVQILEKTGGTVNSTKKFVWIGNSPVEERDASNTVTKRFFAEGEQIGANSYLFNRDHLGSVREMVDLSGNIQARYAYDPYGRRTKVSGSLDADFGYTGHYYHAPSGLHLPLFRAYDTNLGRWLSRDPIGEEGGVNLYAYVENNPTNWIDPLGLHGGAGGQCQNGGDPLAQLADGLDWLGNELMGDSGWESVFGALGVGAAFEKVFAAGAESLNAAQLANFGRFAKKVPANSTAPKIFNLPNGGKAFQCESAAANIPGSFAQYEKQVDAAGKTLQYTKTTFGPNGEIIHTKYK